jgi:hypothetical protein
MQAPHDQELACNAWSAWPHGHPAHDPEHAPKGLCPTFIQKWVFFAIVGILFGLMPFLNGFSSFLGDIGHFWNPNFGRNLGMDKKLQIHINQVCLRPWKIERA